MSTRVAMKKNSVGLGGYSSRNHMANESTHHSINQSIESPRHNAGMYTPMTTNELSRDLQASPRTTKTPQGKGQQSSMQKNSAKKVKNRQHNIKDMMVIYADLNKHVRQENVATNIRQKHNTQQKYHMQTVVQKGS